MSLDVLEETLNNSTGAGENLEYDAAFTEMELAAQPGEERQMGDEVIEATEVDHKLVSEKALDVLSRSKDIRAAVYLAGAQLRLDGFPAFARATTYIRRLLQEHWETCHPELDADDNYDATMRVNAVLGLADPKTAFRSLRLAPITESRTFGRMSVTDLDIANGDVPLPEGLDNPPTNSSIDAAFQDTDPEVLSAMLEGASTAFDDLVAIDTVFTERMPGQGPSLDNPMQVLRKARDRIAQALGAELGEDEGQVTDGESQTVDGGGTAPAPRGEISNAADVTAALDKIIDYYRRKEPSSPVPVLLRRAKMLVNAEFIDIIRDMAPMGLDNVNVIAGQAGEEETY